MALISANGRAYTKQSHRDLESLFAEDLALLSADERVTTLMMVRDRLRSAGVEAFQNSPHFKDLKEIDARGRSLYEEMGDSKFTSQPVSIREFCKNEYYLGKIGKNIYPKLLADLEEVFGGNYSEVIYTGAIGIGKTFFSSIGICYMLYELSLMREPQRSFGLTEDTIIVIAGFSVTEELARDVVLKQIIGKLKTSQYFTENFKIKETQKKIRFIQPDGKYSPIEVVARATNQSGALGMAVYAALMDESDFMPKRKKKGLGKDRFGTESAAKGIYDGIKRRMKSRFGKNGKLFLPCSKSTFDSFIQRRIRAAAVDPTIFVRDYALWDVKPDHYETGRFHVLCGNEQVNSKIIKDPEELERIRASLPDRAALIEVPVNFLPEFESDLEGAIRDTAGIATAAVSPFLQQRDRIHKMITETLNHPYSVYTLDPSVGGHFLPQECVEKVILIDMYGERVEVLKPLLNPSAERHVHIDAATTHCAAAIAMGHVAGQVQVQKTGYLDMAPMIVVDFLLQVVPPPGGEIELSLLRHLVFTLARLGYNITRVTMDQYQSVDSLQQFRAKGYDAERQPTNWEVFQALKNAIYEERVKCYDYPPLFRELRGLECDWERRKVLKPDSFEGERGSKDLADAVASLVYSLSTTPQRVAIGMLKGFSGARAEATGPSWTQGALGGPPPPRRITSHRPGVSGYGQRDGGAVPLGSSPPRVQRDPWAAGDPGPGLPPILTTGRDDDGGWGSYGR